MVYGIIDEVNFFKIVEKITDRNRSSLLKVCQQILMTYELKENCKKQVKNMTRYAVVDLEATDAHSSENKIIQIGIVLVEDGEIVETFSTEVNPDVYKRQLYQQFI